MPRTHVVSSNLRSVGYDPDAAVLQIEFHDGRIYNYHRVPPSRYQGLMNSVSKGGYHDAYIKWSYPYRRVA